MVGLDDLKGLFRPIQFCDPIAPPSSKAKPKLNSPCWGEVILHTFTMKTSGRFNKTQMNHPSTPCVERVISSPPFTEIEILWLNDLPVSFRAWCRICEIKVLIQSFNWEVLLQLLSLVLTDLLHATFPWHSLLKAGSKKKKTKRGSLMKVSSVSREKQ